MFLYNRINKEELKERLQKEAFKEKQFRSTNITSWKIQMISGMNFSALGFRWTVLEEYM